MDLSIVIPAYNEAGRILDTLSAVGRYLAGRSLNAEVIVVDDSSTDGTSTLVRTFAERHPWH